MTMLIHSSPAVASEFLSRLPMVGDRFASPITPARMVAIRDVHSGYIRTRDGHTALLIAGTAQNVGNSPLHTIQINVSLRIRVSAASPQALFTAAATPCPPRWSRR